MGFHRTKILITQSISTPTTIISFCTQLKLGLNPRFCLYSSKFCSSNVTYKTLDVRTMDRALYHKTSCNSEGELPPDQLHNPLRLQQLLFVHVHEWLQKRKELSRSHIYIKTNLEKNTRTRPKNLLGFRRHIKSF